MTLDLDALLAEAVRLGASDLHLKVPAPPHVRIDGVLRPLDGLPALTPEDTAAVLDRVLAADSKRDEWARRGAADVSYSMNGERFRVAAYRQRGSAAFVFRTIAEAPLASALGLPDVVVSWADAPRGLIVVTGPTGSGKSSTCAALLRIVSERRPAHVVTIEDPIEFVHPDRRAIVSQREVGIDAPSHLEALRSALRQDPDVILVGEVRDEETAMTALRAAETGHLVLCTMHTIDACETVQRFVSLFADSRAELAAQLLAATLVGVLSQRLVRALDGGRALCAEVLASSARVRDLIATGGDPHELLHVIAEGDYYGMRSFDQSLAQLVADGRISTAEALASSTSAHDLRLLLTGVLDRSGRHSSAPATDAA